MIYNTAFTFFMMAITLESKPDQSTTTGLPTATPTKTVNRVKKASNKVKGWFRRKPSNRDESATFVEQNIIAPESHDSSSSDVSLEDEPAETELARLKIETSTMQEEITNIKKDSTAEIARVEADKKAIEKELKKAKKLKFGLQNENDHLIAELNQLTTEKDADKQHQYETIEKADSDYNEVVLQIAQNNAKVLKLEDSMALALSWTETLKATQKTNEITNANTHSKLNAEFKQQGEQMDKLVLQVAKKIDEFTIMSTVKDKVTVDLLASRQKLVDSATRKQRLTDEIKTLEAEIAKSAFETSRLEKIIDEQNRNAAELSAINQQLANSESRVRQLESAVVAADVQRLKVKAENEDRIGKLERDLLEFNTTLSAIRQFAQ